MPVVFFLKSRQRQRRTVSIRRPGHVHPGRAAPFLKLIHAAHTDVRELRLMSPDGDPRRRLQLHGEPGMRLSL